jgi:hypothetical protein
MTDISAYSTTDNGTFLTIPDGYHQFKGTITLSASMVGVTGTGAVQYPYVTVEGSPLYFSAGDRVAMVAVGSPTVNLLSLLATSDSNSVVVPVQIQSGAPGSGGFDLKLHFGGATGVSALAVGSYS